jgi:hypothetical protein
MAHCARDRAAVATLNVIKYFKLTVHASAGAARISLTDEADQGAAGRGHRSPSTFSNYVAKSQPKRPCSALPWWGRVALNVRHIPSPGAFKELQMASHASANA